MKNVKLNLYWLFLNFSGVNFRSLFERFLQFLSLSLSLQPSSKLGFELLIELYIDYSDLNDFFIHLNLSVAEETQTAKNSVKTPIFGNVRYK